ncbi:MAG TPA: hypothetical protein VFK91_00415 [Methyloceanibacter sp.]|nr:hypothetical protein [Methyloceanibacter sp.]
MRSRTTLLTTAAAVAIGFAAPAYAQTGEAPGAKSDITIAADTVPSTSGVERSAGGEGANNMNSADVPMTGAGSANAGGPNSEDQGGTGVKGSAQSEGATNKNSAIDPPSGAGASRAGGPSTGLEPGTGVEDSAQGEGATAKQDKPDVKEGKLPSERSTY